MGKKKGGAKNKLARMSEEERARYLQHRADIEEEARRRKQQLIALYMKNKLKREEGFCRLNLAKINQEWRSILRQIKCQELKKEILEVEKNFHELVEQKNRIICRLLNDLDEAEDLYSTLQQSHMENIERLIDIQNQRMDFWKRKYLSEQETILLDCRKDFKKYQEDREKSQVQLECVYYALEDQTVKSVSIREEEHFSKMDDLRSKMTINLERITKEREGRIEELWLDYQNVLNEYVKYTESFLAEYSNLRERDDENTKLIRAHCYDVSKATDLIADLKIELVTLTDEKQLQIAYLEKYRNSLNENYNNLKRDVEDILKYDGGQFKFMVIQSHNIIQSFKKLFKKGESLLQLATMCRRLETKAEKIMSPYGLPKKILCENIELNGPPNELREDAIELWFLLENFWARVNGARINCVNLKEEKIVLEKENTQLKKQLKEYLTNVALKTGSGGKAQDRLQNRPSSMKVEKVAHIDISTGKRFTKTQIKRRPVTCIEGNLSNAVRSLKLVEAKQNFLRPQIPELALN